MSDPQDNLDRETMSQLYDEIERLTAELDDKFKDCCDLSAIVTKQAQRIASLEDEIALTKELHAAILDLIGSEGMTDAKFVRWVETALAKEQDDKEKEDGTDERTVDSDRQ